MKNLIPKIVDIRIIEIESNKTPELIYSKFSKIPFSALLTGKGRKDISRYSFIGINPLYIYNSCKSKKDSFGEFSRLINHFAVDKFKYPANLWGAIGYMSYNASSYIEKLPHKAKNDLYMPDMQMVFYKDMIIFDHKKNKKYLIQIETDVEKFSDHKNILDFKRIPRNKYSVTDAINCCDKNKYITKINKIKKYICDGDVYEVNLSRRCDVKFVGDSYAVFRKLYQINKAPFSAYLLFGEHTIISNSPERFIFANKNSIETRPIKGTAPRGKSKLSDKKNMISLLRSKKDEAELSMIVDLMRNDFGKVCEYGSIKVKEHKRIEQYKNVWHLISIIEGTLKKGNDYGTLLRACFPGGSITGCPKIRSMEIIDELEDYSRNIYTGTIFIVNNSRMDSNIVIRTIIAHKNKLFFNIGGAVVYDSNPESEYLETKHKAKSIMEALS